jgi:hypothetical protein
VTSFRSVVRRIPGADSAYRIVLGGLFPTVYRRVVFDRYYRRNTWGSSESLSGSGSSLIETAAVRRELPLIVRRFGVRSVLDVPCGDFNWMRTVPLAGISYIGGDIVRDLVARNRRLYEAANRHFICLDIVREVPPSADLVICRDLIAHLSFAEARAALENLSSSGSRWLLTTTYPSQDANVDIWAGGWRPLNLQRDPFNFPAPESRFEEGVFERGGTIVKAMGIWRFSDLALGIP